MGRIFEILFDDEESVRLAGALPGSVSELSDRTGLPPERVRELAEKLKKRGAISRLLAKPIITDFFPL